MGAVLGLRPRVSVVSSGKVILYVVTASHAGEEVEFCMTNSKDDAIQIAELSAKEQNGIIWTVHVREWVTEWVDRETIYTTTTRR